jgi:hypothetical protein
MGRGGDCFRGLRAFRRIRLAGGAAGAGVWGGVFAAGHAFVVGGGGEEDRAGAVVGEIAGDLSQLRGAL